MKKEHEKEEANKGNRKKTLHSLSLPFF